MRRAAYSSSLGDLVAKLLKLIRARRFKFGNFENVGGSFQVENVN